MTIGQRAVECIQNRAWENDTTIQNQCDILGFDRSRLVAWRKGKADPDSYGIAEMLQNGYGIEYILIGEKKDNGIKIN